MAMGKIVMSGAEDEILPTYGESEHPVINIRPDPDQICAQIEHLIMNRDKIPAMGEASRRFVEKTHSHILVAKQFMDAWDSR